LLTKKIRHKEKKMKYLFIIALIFGFTSTCLAEKLNVFSENPNHRIYIDGEFINSGVVKNYATDPGSHLVQAKINETIVYSDVVEVETGKVKTIKISRFVSAQTKIASRGAILEEAKRIREAKGNIGLGFNVGVNPGVSLKWFMTPSLAMQGAGWYFDNGTSAYKSWELRGIYTLVDTIINNRPGSLYTALGYGNKINSLNNEDSKWVELCLGIEVSLASKKDTHRYQVTKINAEDFTTGMGLMMGQVMADTLGTFFGLDNAYFSGEIGFTRITSGTNANYTGIIGRIGLHYYF
jgi:hypothetical protein